MTFMLKAPVTVTSDSITPVVLTLDEAPNVARCLDRLRWARRIVVLDSGSTDGTAEIARRYPNVALHSRPFDNHAAQWNHALALVETTWVLTLDADYMVPESFMSEAARLVEEHREGAVYARFRYCVHGKPLRASLYPPRPVLFQPSRSQYVMDGHTQRLPGLGKSATLETPFDHDDRKPFSRWMVEQRKYAALEAARLVATPAAQLEDRIRKAIVLAPPAVLAYTLLVKGAVLDGWPGWYYSFQRMVFELLLSKELIRRRFGGL